MKARLAEPGIFLAACIRQSSSAEIGSSLKVNLDWFPLYHAPVFVMDSCCFRHWLQTHIAIRSFLLDFSITLPPQREQNFEAQYEQVWPHPSMILVL
uniref:Poly(U)-specific endoribonuclease-A-like n=1 Tax=Phallusia mammillata TaxID=59560 RepID=A0A6F9DWR8_9ASCI|nr:poly(U)-specific endoribonuclease-A-like [Phallusia mammillata]